MYYTIQYTLRTIQPIVQCIYYTAHFPIYSKKDLHCTLLNCTLLYSTVPYC